MTDLAVGAIGDEGGGTNRGTVWILFLNDDGTVKDRKKIIPLEEGTSALNDGDFFGRSIASLGDFDGDGVTELAVGAIGDDDGCPNDCDRGAVWILFLNAQGDVKAHQKISGTEGGFTGALNEVDLFGYSTTSLGDLDGDDVPELAVGAIADNDGGLDRGAVWVLFLNDNGTVKHHQKISDTGGEFTGLLDDLDGFGSSLASLGDLDGTADPETVTALAVGAIGDDDGETNRGAVWVLFLNKDGIVKRHQKISTLEGSFTGELDDFDRFGASVADLDDFDDDGVTDLVVGAIGDDDGGANQGAIWILFLNANGTVKRHQKISTLEGGFRGALDENDGFGTAVASLGDINNNGVTDLAVGATGDDDGGTDDGTDRGAVWVVLQALNTMPQVSNVTLDPSSPKEDQGITVSAIITDNIRVRNATLNLRRGGDMLFFAVDMEQSDEAVDLYEILLPPFFATDRGIEYFITATDDAGATTRVPTSEISSISIRVGEDDGVGVRKNTAQPFGNEANAYRLISVPLDLDDKHLEEVFGDDLGAYDDTRWRFYEWRAAEQMAHEFPVLDTSRVDPGDAFFAIVKDGGKFIDSGKGTSVPTDVPFKIRLEPGWNFFGNPFTFSIPLDRIQLARGQPLNTLWTLGEQGWQSPGSTEAIEPFEGYGVFSEQADVLEITPGVPVENQSAAARNNEVVGKQSTAWSIRIRAHSRLAYDLENYAAVTANAATAWDLMDQPEPPPIGDYVSVYFPHPEWKKILSRFSTDARPVPRSGAVWPVEVITARRDAVHLTFEGLAEVPPEFEVWLVDERLGITQDLRQTASYTVIGGGVEDPRPLTLAVGRPGFLAGEVAAAEAIPKRFELFPNFPNPFNPATTIRYGLPEASEVSLIVYDVLGRRVAVLARYEEQTAGYHAVIWDGRDAAGRQVASGVYFARMRAGHFVQTQRMILVK